MLWVLRLLGYPTLTFGPEMLSDESEDELRVSNTGGSFTRADGPYSTDFLDEEPWEEYEEDEEDPSLGGFGFRL